ncbi:sodium/potassium/calcium exchanger Nckx30C-like, partial [Oppia nitens]|uniref:sodium/potassium/calcium exchanger Nckx30C-like n=1 Tax=Oppia nitens TaxID=1686743 RepID=UPI0023DB5164
MGSFNYHYFRLWRKFYRKLWRKLIFVLLITFLTFTLIFVKPKASDECVFNDDECNYQQFVRSRLLLSEPNVDQNLTISSTIDPLVESEGSDKKFPEDLFTPEQRRKGAVIFHIAGLIYMFVALAIVCDEFFIPSLDVITEKLDISEDVAGATFMAAGGSAPELFTSIIGVFISFDDVGIGTIVGSAVFNILFVISMCAIFSKSVLSLTWWPLFRDVSFYSVILISLVICFKDSLIHWYEALFLLLWYVGYVTFMKYNEIVEKYVKKFVNRSKVDKIKTENPESPPPMQTNRKMSTPILHGGSKFRQGVLQLMIHSIDPLHEETITNAMRSGIDKSRCIHPPGATTCVNCGDIDNHNSNGNSIFHTANMAIKTQEYNSQLSKPHNGSIGAQNTEESDEPDEPLDMSWPKTMRKRFTYVLLAPIIFPLWLTLPDTRRPEKRKWFPFAFLGSIMWIAIYSYLMVWWATLVGTTFKMPSEVMGLTFLAAGTSIPDLITSVLVARKGFGDMAVSSSVGSNIFDVTVGLPLPWFLYTIIFGTVTVNSKGMICSVLLLFLMLMFVILTIALFKWSLNVGMAIVMFILYFIFIAISLMLENNTIKCSS